MRDEYETLIREHNKTEETCSKHRIRSAYDKLREGLIKIHQDYVKDMSDIDKAMFEQDSLNDCVPEDYDELITKFAIMVEDEWKVCIDLDETITICAYGKWLTVEYRADYGLPEVGIDGWEFEITLSDDTELLIKLLLLSSERTTKEGK